MITRTRLLFAIAVATAPLIAGCAEDGGTTRAPEGSRSAAATTATPATTAPGSDAAPAFDDSQSAVKGCSTTPPTTPPTGDRYDAYPEMGIDPAKTYTVTFETSCGRMVAELLPKQAPKTVNSFVFLARKRFFDGLTFHRALPDFVIQGGDPEGTGAGGPGYQFEDELPQDSYREGDLAMANAGPNTNGSQFFVITGPNGAALDRNYSLFGRLTSGLDVAKRIESLNNPDDPKQGMKQPVFMYSVTVAEK